MVPAGRHGYLPVSYTHLVQTDLTDALKTAAKLYPDIDFVHSDFTGYMECLKQELKEDCLLYTSRGHL